jgi:DNA-binding LacI/PurR family transcriptional regulator
LRYLELLAERRVDGLIVASDEIGQRFGERLATLGPPVVLVNCQAVGSALAAFVSDNEAGGRLAAEHLIGLGHRKLGFIAGPPAVPASRERSAGAVAAVAAAGAAPGSGVEIEVLEGALHIDDGAAAATALLARRPDITALACHNDLVALGAIRAVRLTSRHVPAQISVVGFDGIAFSAFADPPLTTIVQDVRSMGRQAVEAIVGRRAAAPEPTEPTETTEPTEPTVRRLPVRLLRRESTAAPPT